MRILNVTQTYAPFYEFGGPPVKVRALSRGLAALGNKVGVLTADWGLEKRLPPEAERKGVDRSPFGWRVEDEGVQTIYLNTYARYRTVTWNPPLRRFCRARLKNFDVVHIFGVYDFLGPRVAQECRAQNVPYVIEPVGMYVPIVRSLLMKRMYHALLGRDMFAGAAAIVATSEQEREELAAAGVAREKIVLRRNGVAGPEVLPERGKFRAKHNIPERAKVVLFFGRLSSKKSPELLLRSFAALPSAFSGAPLRLVFAGPDESGMQARLGTLAAQLGIADRVLFPGAIFGDEKWSVYTNADVFVLPSQNENFGNTAAESIAVGVPVIVTENCGIAPLITGAGLVVPHQEQAMTAALESMLQGPDLRAELAAGCVAVTERLGWDEPVAAMERLYQEVIDKSRSVLAATGERQ